MSKISEEPGGIQTGSHIAGMANFANRSFSEQGSSSLR
jgi:hypothetical protein